MTANRLIFDDKERVGAWVAERVEQTSPWGWFYAMGVERDGELAAGIVFNGHNGSNMQGHIAVARTVKQLPELIRHALQYVFVQLKLNRFTCLVDVSNLKSMRLVEHIGFEKEFLIHRGAPGGGDLQMYVMWPEKCRWLEDK